MTLWCSANILLVENFSPNGFSIHRWSFPELIIVVVAKWWKYSLLMNGNKCILLSIITIYLLSSHFLSEVGKQDQLWSTLLRKKKVRNLIIKSTLLKEFLFRLLKETQNQEQTSKSKSLPSEIHMLELKPKPSLTLKTHRSLSSSSAMSGIAEVATQSQWHSTEGGFEHSGFVRDCSKTYLKRNQIIRGKTWH